jgi:hypothetical protein
MKMREAKMDVDYGHRRSNINSENNRNVKNTVAQNIYISACSALCHQLRLRSYEADNIKRQEREDWGRTI